MTRFVWERSLVISLFFVAIVATLLWSFIRTIDRQMELRSVDIAREIGEDIRLLVESHVDALKIVTDVSHENWILDDSAYRENSEALMRAYPGFFGITIVDKEGFVRKVYPLERNRIALGRRNPRTASLREYSRDHHVPVISSRVMTIQGVEGFVVYIPYESHGEFVGWVAGLLDLQGWMSKYLATKTEEGVSVRVRFGYEPDADYEYGAPMTREPLGHVQAQILNQAVTIDVSLRDPSEPLPRWWLGGSVVSFGALVSLLLTALVVSQQRSLQRLTAAHRSLAVKNSLVSSLTHDLGTPLTVLSLSIDRIDAEKKLEPRAWERLRKSTRTLRTMLESVRLFHAADLGRLKLEVKPVDLHQVTEEALDEVRELAERKNIRVLSTIAKEIGSVYADRTTLAFNVLPNLLTNAIKFSRAGGSIYLEAEAQKHTILLRVIDHGVGIPREDLKAFLEHGERIDTDPLPGEKGSGVGLLQVRTFMELYRGSFDVQSRTAGEGDQATGTRVTLSFRRAPSEI